MSDPNQPDDERGAASREELYELRQRVDALHRKVSSFESTLESLQNQLDHLKGGSKRTNPFQGQKSDLVEQLEPGEKYSNEELRMKQQGIAEEQKKKNARHLLESDWFVDHEELPHGTQVFRGNPETNDIEFSIDT